VSTGARCIVPKIPKNRSLASVTRRLKAANCTVGKVSHRRSRTRRRGLVLALSPGVGSRLSPRATVRIVVSSGRPR
jgi:beta-lactam-binding protein with PASTA domain